MSFFSIYVSPIRAGSYVPWAYHSHRQLLSMQHGVLLLIECMRLLPEPDLPRVTLLVFLSNAHFSLFSRLLAGRSTMLIVPSSTTKCELPFLCPYNVTVFLMISKFYRSHSIGDCGPSLCLSGCGGKIRSNTT